MSPETLPSIFKSLGTLFKVTLESVSPETLASILKSLETFSRGTLESESGDSSEYLIFFF